MSHAPASRRTTGHGPAAHVGRTAEFGHLLRRAGTEAAVLHPARMPDAFRAGCEPNPLQRRQSRPLPTTRRRPSRGRAKARSDSDRCLRSRVSLLEQSSMRSHLWAGGCPPWRIAPRQGGPSATSRRCQDRQARHAAEGNNGTALTVCRQVQSQYVGTGDHGEPHVRTRRRSARRAGWLAHCTRSTPR